MSLLWPDRLLVSLAPGEISWIRLDGHLKPEVRDKGVVPADPGYGAHPWEGALAALRTKAQAWRADRLSVRIVLSNHFVRYALSPYSDQIQGVDQELALARFHFSKVHGEVSRAWDIRLSPAAPGASRLASAVDSALVEALRQCFGQAGRPRLASVQPLLMSMFNSADAAIPSSGAWLVMAEPERTCIALLCGKVWHTVQNVRGRYADDEAWIALVERERWRLSLESAPDTLVIHSTQAREQLARSRGPWKMTSLRTRWPQGMQAARDHGYSAALSAA